MDQGSGFRELEHFDPIRAHGGYQLAAVQNGGGNLLQVVLSVSLTSIGSPSAREAIT